MLICCAANSATRALTAEIAWASTAPAASFAAVMLPARMAPAVTLSAASSPPSTVPVSRAAFSPPSGVMARQCVVARVGRAHFAFGAEAFGQAQFLAGEQRSRAVHAHACADAKRGVAAKAEGSAAKLHAFQLRKRAGKQRLRLLRARNQQGGSRPDPARFATWPPSRPRP